jgi:hypothetical protein
LCKDFLKAIVDIELPIVVTKILFAGISWHSLLPIIMNNRLEQEAADGKGGTMNREATGTAEIQKRVSREWIMRASCLLMPSFLLLIAIIGGRCEPSQKH